MLNAYSELVGTCAVKSSGELSLESVTVLGGGFSPPGFLIPLK